MALEYFLGGDAKTCKEPGRSDPKDHLVGPSLKNICIHPVTPDSAYQTYFHPQKTPPNRIQDGQARRSAR